MPRRSRRRPVPSGDSAPPCDSVPASTLGGAEPKISYVLEDDLHAETLAESPDKEAALAEAYRRAALPWDDPVNKAPCVNWRHCGRHLMLATYDRARRSPDELSREPVVRIDAAGVHWAGGYERPPS